ncbi:helicase-exonuclease AddAB subunit AddA [Lawsonibacter sp. LCP25S3_F5]
MAFPLTPEQQDIVQDRGGELLVSAAAGSGKTRVLVERLLDRVTEEGLDIDRFLVITYTKAAAAELRTRVAQELAVRLAERPHDRHLQRQLTLVYKAQISTIHAFCSVVLRESGHLLDLDPDFRLCDEGEAQVLMARVLEQTLDRRYEGVDPQGPFAQLVDTLSAGRDDSRLAQIVLDIAGRVQSHPDPARWLGEEQSRWQLVPGTDMEDTPWGAILLEELRRRCYWCRKRLGQALDLVGEDELLKANYAPALYESAARLDKLLSAHGWDETTACLPIPFPTLGRKKKRAKELDAQAEMDAADRAERIKSIRSRCKKQLEKLSALFQENSRELGEELALARPVVQALMDLTTDFLADYAREKRRRGLVDFSDLEHLTVKLLLDDQGQPTQAARMWADRFEEVQVDEYQDTNQVQNAIFQAISHQGRTLFQVGDVKQSIYRFRLADPTIFLDKYRRFPDGASARPGQPRRRVLSRNFRSRPQVLLGCNDLFRNVMSGDFGELDYTEDQALVPGAAFPDPEGADYALELDVLDLAYLGEQSQEDRENKDQAEARFAARRVRELLDKPMMVTEGDHQRPLRPSDVMILLRSPGAVLHYYTRALGEENIPWVADGNEDFLSTTEVNVALAILRLVDNPRQDVPLLAALRSPVYGFTADRLAELRAADQGEDFYSAVVAGAARGEQDCADFLDQLERLRFGAGDRTCRQLIWHIYETADLLGVFGAMNEGRKRQENLLSFYALAGQMEDGGCRTLFQFLLRLDRLRQTGGKLTAARPAQEGEGVSILSIHRSKGLEKPVVLVCGLSRRLNRDDLKAPVLFHPELGVGPKGLEPERMVQYPTLARQAVALRLDQEMMAEELRLLYVAMTRAREKLILSVALTAGSKTLADLGEDLSLPVSPMTLSVQPSVGHWVLLYAMTRPEASLLRALGGPGHDEDFPDPDIGPGWDIRWVNDLSEDQADRDGVIFRAEEKAQADDGPEPDLSWRYPHLALADVPSKVTATQRKGRPLDQEAAEEGMSTDLPQSEPAIHRPRFAAEERGLTAAQRGTALHQAMQYLPLTGDHSPEGVRAELDRLTREGFLTPMQRQAIRPAVLSAFFQSDLGRAMCAARECRREFKFSLLVPAREYEPQAEAGEEVLLQGVIDAWFDDGDGVTVIDFKSDRIQPGGEALRGEEYRQQLSAYSRALEEILGRPVRRRVLWFFATGRAWDV